MKHFTSDQPTENNKVYASERVEEEKVENVPVIIEEIINEK